MKKIFRALTLCLVLLSLLCAAVPAAFAAGNKEDAFIPSVWTPAAV